MFHDLHKENYLCLKSPNVQVVLRNKKWWLVTWGGACSSGVWLLEVTSMRSLRLLQFSDTWEPYMLSVGLSMELGDPGALRV